MTNAITNQFQAASGTTATEPKKAGNSELNKDAFLKLLVTQLQYQNPLEPMEDKEFISQMASFSSLEQMQNVANAMGAIQDSLDSVLLPSILMQQAYSMLGREITYATLEDGVAGTKSGVVQAVSVKDGSPYYYLENDVGVYEYQVLKVAAAKTPVNTVPEIPPVEELEPVEEIIPGEETEPVEETAADTVEETADDGL